MFSREIFKPPCKQSYNVVYRNHPAHLSVSPSQHLELLLMIGVTIWIFVVVRNLVNTAVPAN